MFLEGLDIAHEHVLRCLELMWMKFLDDASHYNHITGQFLSQLFPIRPAVDLALHISLRDLSSCVL